MQPLHQKSPLFECGLPLLLTVGIFVLDLSAPAGIDLWLLYAVPFTLIAVSSLGQVPRYFMGLVALLAFIGLLCPPPDPCRPSQGSIVYWASGSWGPWLRWLPAVGLLLRVRMRAQACRPGRSRRRGLSGINQRQARFRVRKRGPGLNRRWSVR